MYWAEQRADWHYYGVWMMTHCFFRFWLCWKFSFWWSHSDLNQWQELMQLLQELNYGKCSDMVKWKIQVIWVCGNNFIHLQLNCAWNKAFSNFKPRCDKTIKFIGITLSTFYVPCFWLRIRLLNFTENCCHNDIPTTWSI